VTRYAIAAVANPRQRAARAMMCPPVTLCVTPYLSVAPRETEAVLRMSCLPASTQLHHFSRQPPRGGMRLAWRSCVLVRACSPGGHRPWTTGAPRRDGHSRPPGAAPAGVACLWGCVPWGAACPCVRSLGAACAQQASCHPLGGCCSVASELRASCVLMDTQLHHFSRQAPRGGTDLAP
jgi:hypothetical protein